MRTEQELLGLTTHSLEKGDYQAIIDLLTDEVLQKFKSARLYFYRGISYDKMLFFSKAINDYTNAIYLESNLVTAYNNRGISFISIGENDKAIDDFTSAILLKNDHLEAYINRGLVWLKKCESDKAFIDFDTTVKLNGKYAIGYYNRGNSYLDRGEYKKAIKDFSLAINNNEHYYEAFNNRGNSWYKMEDLAKAWNDYNSAISINSNFYFAYVGRGLVHAKNGNYDNAIIDFNKAIEINNEYDDAYFNKGLAYYFKCDYEKSIENFYCAYKLYNEKGIYELRGYDKMLYFHVLELIKNLTTEFDLKEIWRHHISILLPVISEIRNIARDLNTIWDVNQKTEKLVAHYTNLRTSDILLTGENSKLRYSNAVFMNDPEEGKILINYLDKLQKQDITTNAPKIKKAFDSVLDQEQSNFYLGSFLPVVDQHEDELIMWRTYGKDENQKEAAGCCLIIDTAFFDMYDQGYIATGSKDTEQMPQLLYKVLYYDQRKNEFPQDKTISNLLIELKERLVGLLEMKKEEDTEDAKKYNTAIDKVLYHSLSELRYFFKSADFAYENELRVIQYATNKDVVKIDDQSNTLPRKVFIESTKPLLPHLKEIVLGPKVPHPERWMYLQKIMTDKGHDFKLRHSNCRFQ